MIGLQCAVCLHVAFAAAENDREPAPRVAYAETLIGGTALCRLHIEDYDRAHGNWLLSIACRIIGVRPPHRGFGL